MKVPVCSLCGRRWRGKQACVAYTLVLWGALLLVGPWLTPSIELPQSNDLLFEARPDGSLPATKYTAPSDPHHAVNNSRIRHAFLEPVNSAVRHHNETLIEKVPLNSDEDRYADKDVLRRVDGIVGRVLADAHIEVGKNLVGLDDDELELRLLQAVTELFETGGADEVFANLSVSELGMLQTWLQRGLDSKRRRVPSAPAARRTEMSNLESRRCDGCFQRDFKYVLNSPDICRDGTEYASLDAILLILSSPKNYKERQVIRQTWSDADVVKKFQRTPFYRVRHVFLLGMDGNAYQQRRVRMEHKLYRDMIQQDFTDSYQNLTLKTLMGLDWAQSQCPRARYVIKVDDDVYLNAQALLDVINHTNSVDTVYGHCSKDKEPIRKTLRASRSKWVVKKAEYPWAMYPPYCEGPAYAMSLALARDIVRIHPNIPYFRMEDVYIGLCLQALRATVTHLRHFVIYMFITDEPIPCYRLNYDLVVHKLHSLALLRTYKSCFHLQTDLEEGKPKIGHGGHR